MSYQYAASYPPSRDADGWFARIYSMLGTVMSRRNGFTGRRQSLAIIRRRLFTVPTALVLLWILVLYWGERTVFSNHIAACDWAAWEDWPARANPHRVALVADPQLVDPHTYPGRPWPLSALTVTATDKYLKRSYRLLQRSLDPDTVFFLGDLFDGGREWGTYAKGFQPSEERWKGYGESFWLQEYDRFGKIFFAPDQVSGGLPLTKAKKTFASLPGNHDLGFGRGIQKPVKDRFRTYFGESDRVDVVGNHTFVSLDTVSLSAMGLPDAEDSTWNGTLQFLNQAQDLKSRAVQQALHMQNTATTRTKYAHEVTHSGEFANLAEGKSSKKGGKPEFPTIVLSHVPLYRDPDTPCGPLRERSPPSAPNLEHDGPNAIRVAAGYQYQNVLTLDISRLIAEKVANVGYAFSGDDHDYCELTHESYASAGSGIREITVKSISWAMGVRHPGFVMLSLWNPVNSEGKTMYDIEGGQKTGEPTLQSHLCLMPDQLAIYIRYGICAAISLTILAIHSLIEVKKNGINTSNEESLLPVSESRGKVEEKQQERDWDRKRSRAASGSLHPSSNNNNNNLSSRSWNQRSRPVSPLPVPISSHGYEMPRFHRPLVEQAGYFGTKNFDIQDGETDDWGNPPMKLKPRKPKSFLRRLVDRLGVNIGLAGGPIMLYYWWLLWNG